MAGNKILLAKKRGDTTIPEGWANDEQGRPTTDTRAASQDHLQWFGGHKGYGIAFFVVFVLVKKVIPCFVNDFSSACETSVSSIGRLAMPWLSR